MFLFLFLSFPFPFFPLISPPTYPLTQNPFLCWIQYLYCYYAQSGENPNFQRRIYWLGSKPFLVMVYYIDLDEDSDNPGNQPKYTGIPHPSFAPSSSAPSLPLETVPLSENDMNHHQAFPIGESRIPEKRPEPVFATNLPSPMDSHTFSPPLYFPPKLDIIDFSPEWAFSDGGTKILVNFASNYDIAGPYFCRFGELYVPATLISPGVLRVLTPGLNSFIFSFFLKKQKDF